jgi:hypothetical protein
MGRCFRSEKFRGADVVGVSRPVGEADCRSCRAKKAHRQECLCHWKAKAHDQNGVVVATRFLLRRDVKLTGGQE